MHAGALIHCKGCEICKYNVFQVQSTDIWGLEWYHEDTILERWPYEENHIAKYKALPIYVNVLI